MRSFGLLEAATFFAVALPLEVEHSKHQGLEKAARLIQKEAKHELGTYQGAVGQFPAWAPLAASTLARKAADTPGVETGEMRDSIEYVRQGDEAEVGSNLDKAVFFELGTVHQPPRSFLGGAAARMEDKVVDVCGRYVAMSIAGTPIR